MVFSYSDTTGGVGRYVTYNNADSGEYMLPRVSHITCRDNRRLWVVAKME